MSEIHLMVTGRIPRGDHFNRTTKGFSGNRERAMIELKQLINSLSQSGIVNQIEDRESPFNGMLVDMIFISRVLDDENDDPADDYEEIEEPENCLYDVSVDDDDDDGDDDDR
jgi:hypothetical protein